MTTIKSRFNPVVQQRIDTLMRFCLYFAYDPARRTQAVDMANSLAVRNPGNAALRKADRLIGEMTAALPTIPACILKEIRPYIED